MSLTQLGSAPPFQNHVQGMIGDFVTPAGTVAYLMTKARLGADATDPERRLTEHLVPVREVIPAEELDFNQLLQRDLDDHRVAVNLVPYLLKDDWTGPAFFPPIVAIALPFAGQHPSEFPEFGDTTTVEENEDSWRQQDAGQHFRVRRLLDKAGQLHPIALGQVWWNKEFCKIVVIDGQHRAMALLAIDRTIRQTWEAGAGAKYRYFYEARIKEALRDKTIKDIEVPVTLLWFPERFGKGKHPHKAARKLFVDVNKEARTPSESRLILLSDGELVNILTRATLTQLRNQADNEYLPLYCVEYDNPDTKYTQSARWSALTNIHILKQMVTRMVFGPPKYITRMDAPIIGRESEDQRDAFMRNQLNVESLFPLIINGDEPFERCRLGNTGFPESSVSELTEQYRNTWGSGILILLSRIKPWNAHARALTKLKENWLVDNAIASLARDALFSGVGMYWTLRDSFTHWMEIHAGAKARSGKPDVLKAWDMIAAKQTEFEQMRAEELLGSKSKRDAANQVYQAMNTHACQLGIALTLATLFRQASNGTPDVVDLAEAMADGVNDWMLSKTSGDYDRRLVLAKRRDDSPKNALNVITNMDMPRAVQFRYFWLEILASPQGLAKLMQVVDETKVKELRDKARAAYVRYVAGEKARALKTSQPELTERERKERALEDARGEVRRALIKWFDLPAAEIDAWYSSAAVSAASVDDQEYDTVAGERFEEPEDIQAAVDIKDNVGGLG